MSRQQTLLQIYCHPGPASVILNWDVIPGTSKQDVRIANRKSANDNYLQSLIKKIQTRFVKIVKSEYKSSNHFRA